MSAKLVIVPSTVWAAGLNMFGGTGVLVLDELLNQGPVGMVFRRLRLRAAIHPKTRVEYDRVRQAYLRVVLAELDLSMADLVVVGTHPDDVDLLEFDQVAAVKVSEREMRVLSRKVYGDPVMMCAEYASVVHSIDDAVDVWHYVTAYEELPVMLMRSYPNRKSVDVVISSARQRELLRQQMADFDDIDFWFGDSLRLESSRRQFFLVADYDYLSVILPVWRDAVVCFLGRAPGIEDVFRLPWFVVDAVEVHSLCFRPNSSGMPTVSMRGASLVEFVRSRLDSVFTTRELVGTWIGALLCDDATAVDTLNALGFSTLAPVDLAPATAFRCPQSGYEVRVPEEYAWMYVAVPDVRVVTWEGQRDVAGKPYFETAPDGWATTLVVAQRFFSSQYSPMEAVAVVQLMRRLHAVGVSSGFLRGLESHALESEHFGIDSESYDSLYTPYVPGYNYLFSFSPIMRLPALQFLGRFPNLGKLLEHAKTFVGCDGFVSVNELSAEASRAMLYAGRTAKYVFDHITVGARSDLYPRGQCYLSIFRSQHHARVANELGFYPKLSRVMGKDMRGMWIDDPWTKLQVTYVSSLVPTSSRAYRCEVVHFSAVDGCYVEQCGVELDEDDDTSCGDVPEGSETRLLGDYIKSYVRQEDGAIADAVVVGGVPRQLYRRDSQCYSQTWFVSAVVSWTIVGVVVVSYFAWLLYKRCSGGGNRSYGGYRR